MIRTATARKQSKLIPLLIVVFFAALPAQSDVGMDNNVAWMINCQGCHRADGGATSDQVPALRGSVAKFLTVDGGREYLIRVPGVSMAPLSDESIASLTNWMLNEFDREDIPADFKGYTADEVRELRQEPYSSEAGTIRAGLLEKIDRLALLNTDLNGVTK